MGAWDRGSWHWRLSLIEHQFAHIHFVAAPRNAMPTAPKYKQHKLQVA